MKAIVLGISLLAFGTGAYAETQVPASQGQVMLSFAPVVKRAAPAVVNIFAKKIVQANASPFSSDPFFGQLFRDFSRTVPQVQNALGSGVIVSPDGLVVSNYHVVGDASEIKVALNDRREFEATVVLADKEADLAVLKLKGGHDLPALSFRDSDKIEVGDLVLAIGDPFGVGQTVSSGIISGLARSGLSIGGGRGYYVQTDAAINPGNSGGALVDLNGRLVGINSAILTQSGGSNGIGFAIPSNLVSTFVEQARAGNKHFQRPWAGVTGQAVDQALAESMGLDRPDGMVISDLQPGSPLVKAGLAVGDVVLSVGDEPVNTPQEMMFRMSAIGVGHVANVGYVHDGHKRVGQVALVSPPETPPRDTTKISGDVVLRGLTIERINPAVISELGSALPQDGVVVTAVEDLAGQTGLKEGDVIQTINGKSIKTPADVVSASNARTRLWQLDILRHGERLRLRFTI